MMRRLQIRLLGPFQAILDGKPVAHFETQKARALLAYLAAEGDQPHQREYLAEMLWPDRPEGAARANLRHTLGELRSILEERIPSNEPNPGLPCLLVTRETIQLNPEADLWVDTAAFTRLVAGSVPAAKLPMDRLEEAVGLYRGAFLEDLCVADSTVFQEWILVKREKFQSQILEAFSLLAKCFAIWGRYDRSLEYAWRQVELSPWNEAAHQQVIRFLALTGQPGAALDYYEVCRRVLAEELGVEPGEEIKQLREQIRSGKLEIPIYSPILSKLQPTIHLPGFLEDDAISAESPIFIARERELAKLEGLFKETLQGHTRLTFVVGDAGQGKTALINEFARRSMDANPDLLVASGSCNACTGAGDPYLPFRDIMAMLTGDVETRWAAGLINCEHARRLWQSQALAIQVIAASSGSLIDTILPGEELIFRTALAAPDRVDWLERWEELIRQRRSGEIELEQSHLFEQYADVLRFLSGRYPLILLLDDVQWADNSSIGLLFHLGRRLADSRVLIICAYRPEEVDSKAVREHPALAKVLLEFKRIYGDVWIDLNQTERKEGRRFVDALIDTEPNRLPQLFREALFQRTEGHPLFTIELLRSMQERHDLLQEEDGYWIGAPTLNWELLPARVEAVIQERIERLDPELQQILTIACMQGEIFTAQVVAEVGQITERQLMNLLAQKLDRQHRLVREHEVEQTLRGRISHYRFRHVLFRDYLYKQLTPGERKLLHGEIATALEKLHQEQLDEIAAQLAYHFKEAGDHDCAFHYFVLAARRAARLYANDESLEYFSQAIEIAPQVSPDASEFADLYYGRGLVWDRLGDFERSRADYERTLQIVRHAGEQMMEWRTLVDLGRLWASRDYQQSFAYYEQALHLARRIGDQTLLATSLNWLGNWYINAENPDQAIRSHLEALAIFEETGAQRDLANTLDLLGIASLLGGDCLASAAYYDRAIELYRTLDDLPGLASSLTGRGNIGGAAHYSLAVASPINASTAVQNFEEAIQISRETGSSAGQAWALWSLGLLLIVQGQYGRALEVIQNSLQIASEIEHLEWIVGSQSILGVLHIELFAPEEARRYLEKALMLARELRSQNWIHEITGSLASVSLLQGDLRLAQTCLDEVITRHTRMDTLHIRNCWALRAQLALSQGDPAYALEISDRLIASACGLASGQVITFLWLLKGEALAAIGHTSEAIIFLKEALENAQVCGERFLLWRVRASLGKLCKLIDNTAYAEKEFHAASELINEMAASLPDGGLKDNFLQGAHRALTSIQNPE